VDEGKALLQAICESPQDDAPRLVYADWLDEHGQADRAELIRVQIERARLEEFEPRWFDLAARERTLLDRRGSVWRGGLPAWTRKEWCWFRRGFPARLSTTISPFLKGAAGLWRSGPVDALVVRKATAAHLAKLADCPALGRLDRLDLSSRNQEPGANWYYYNDPIQAEGARILADSPHLGLLRALDLSFQRIGDDGARALASSTNLGSLTELDLTCASVGRAGVEALIDSPHRDRLTSLSLTARDLGVGVIAALHCFSNLKRLVLHETRSEQGPGPATVLERLSSQRPLKLSVLTLSQVYPEGYRRPALVGALPPAGLRALELHSCFLNEEDARQLAGSPRAASLRLLNLRQNLIGNAGAQALADSAHLAGLTVLDIRENSITDEGARALLRSPHLGNLRLLDLEINQFSPPVLAQLRERFGDAVRCSWPSSRSYSSHQVAECHFFTRKTDPTARAPGILPGGKP
jgi:uncharacterized protein (TIGR02996 family)